MAKIFGIDVSHHQGTIDWESVKQELYRVNGGNNAGFAIIRVGYGKRDGTGGLVCDGQAIRNLTECNRLNIPCGVYVYCYDASAAAAAQTMRETMEKIKGFRIEYPVVYDVEYEKANLTAGKAGNTAIIKAAMQVVEDAGYYGMVYCSRNFFQQYTNLSELGGFDKWEAAYTATDTEAIPDNGLWQYSSKNALGIAGFGNSLDCDVAYKDYPAIIKKADLNHLSDGALNEGDREQVTAGGTMIFSGRNQVLYPYSRYGYTRSNGTVWHGGIDIVGMDDKVVRMPWYDGKSISGTVLTARIVTNKSNKTWEWGYYVCVNLDRKQTPDAVNYLYFAHNSKLLVKAGQKVKSGDALAIMGNTGNAALNNPPFAHVHFEVRAGISSKGLDPVHYTGIVNKVGVYSAEYSDGIEDDSIAVPDAPCEPYKWDANRFEITCTGEDKKALQELVERLELPCVPIFEN